MQTKLAPLVVCCALAWSTVCTAAAAEDPVSIVRWGAEHGPETTRIVSSGLAMFTVDGAVLKTDVLNRELIEGAKGNPKLGAMDYYNFGFEPGQFSDVRAAKAAGVTPTFGMAHSVSGDAGGFSARVFNNAKSGLMDQDVIIFNAIGPNGNVTTRLLLLWEREDFLVSAPVSLTQVAWQTSVNVLTRGFQGSSAQVVIKRDDGKCYISEPIMPLVSRRENTSGGVPMNVELDKSALLKMRWAVYTPAQAITAPDAYGVSLDALSGVTAVGLQMSITATDTVQGQLGFFSAKGVPAAGAELR